MGMVRHYRSRRENPSIDPGLVIDGQVEGRVHPCLLFARIVVFAQADKLSGRVCPMT